MVLRIIGFFVFRGTMQVLKLFFCFLKFNVKTVKISFLI